MIDELKELRERFEFPDDESPELMYPNGEWGPTVYATHWMPLPDPHAEKEPEK